MDGFFLLLGHLIGDYVAQNDWMAKNKAAPYPSGERPCSAVVCESGGYMTAGTPADREAWDAERKQGRFGDLACTAHCLAYTAAVWACSFWWMPWWGLAVCFLAHWPLDRFRLAGRWMRNVAGQSAFASGPLAPWSVIVVDNVFHLITLGLIAAASGNLPR